MARSAVTDLQLTFETTVRNILFDDGFALSVVGQQLVRGKMASGLGVRQTNRAWEDRNEVLLSGNTVDIDLYDFAGIDHGAGVGNDALGQDLTVEEIVVLIIKQTAGPGRLEIMPTSPAGGLSWVPSQTVANGGALRVGGVRLYYEPDADALDVEDGVSHVLRLGASGGDVTFSLYLAGRHDDNESSSSSSTSSSSQSGASSSSVTVSTSSSSPSSESSSSQSSLSSLSSQSESASSASSASSLSSPSSSSSSLTVSTSSSSSLSQSFSSQTSSWTSVSTQSSLTSSSSSLTNSTSTSLSTSSSLSSQTVSSSSSSQSAVSASSSTLSSSSLTVSSSSSSSLTNSTSSSSNTVSSSSGGFGEMMRGVAPTDTIIVPAHGDQDSMAGTNGRPALTIVATHPNRVLMPNGGLLTKQRELDGTSGLFNRSLDFPVSSASWVDLIEQEVNVDSDQYGETVCGQLGNGLASRFNNGSRFCLFSSLRGGRMDVNIDGVMIDSIHWGNQIGLVQRAIDEYPGAKVAAVPFSNGHAMALLSATQTGYRDDLDTLQQQLEDTLQYMTNQSERIPLLIEQPHHANYQSNPTESKAVILGARDARIKYHWIGISHPSYVCQGTVNQKDNAGYKMAGRYFAKAIDRAMELGEPADPLCVDTITRSGATITLTLKNNVGNVALDTLVQGQHTDEGFDYTDDGDVVGTPTISTVVVTDAANGVITITLSSDPSTNANQRLSYGRLNDSGTDWNDFGGNVRDSDTYTAPDGTRLYNWLECFEEDPQSYAEPTEDAAPTPKAYGHSLLTGPHSETTISQLDCLKLWLNPRLTGVSAAGTTTYDDPLARDSRWDWSTADANAPPYSIVNSNQFFDCSSGTVYIDGPKRFPQGDFTIAFVGRYTQNGDTNAFAGSGVNLSGSQRTWRTQLQSNNCRLQINNVNFSGGPNVSIGGTGLHVFVCSYRLATNQISTSVDGGAVSTNTLATLHSNYSPEIRAFRYLDDVARVWDGDAGDILVFACDLHQAGKSADLDEVVKYLQNKAGLQ